MLSNMEKAMRTTSLKTIYLTIPELKEAIARYIRDEQWYVSDIRDEQGKMGPEDLHTHLMNNEWSMDWTSEGAEFAISIDGEIKDE